MSDNIESFLHEERRFSPSEAFKAKAKINTKQEYERLYRQSLDDPEAFWGDVANELHWFKQWDKLAEWNEPFAKWFLGGQTNISYNCLEHQIAQGRSEKAAIIWKAKMATI